MPTYEYKCDNCRHLFEHFQSINASPLRKCPACGKLKLKRLLGTGVGVIFKGSGFYETDYRSENYKQAAKKETDAGKDTSTKIDKPAAASDNKSSEKKESKLTATETKTETKPTANKKKNA